MTRYHDSVMVQRLASAYRTAATVLSDSSLQCETPSELKDGYGLDSGGDTLEISLLLTANQQEYRPKNAHQALELVRWPVIRSISAGHESGVAERGDIRLPLLEPFRAGQPSRRFKLDTDVDLGEF